jgi:DNA polymerase-3 subunit alpha
MDSFGERGSMLNSLDMILSLATKIQKERSSSQIDLFGASEDPTVTLPDIQLIAPPEPIATHTLLAWERELLGLYLSHHPLEEYEAFLQDNAIPIADITPEKDGKMAKVGGTISDIRQITTKNGQNMAFVKLEDRTGELELIIFPNLYKDSQSVWERDKVILVEGKVTARDKEGVLMQDVKFMPDSARVVAPEEAKDYEPTGKKIGFTEAKKRTWPGKKEEQKIIANPKSSAPAKLYLRVIDDTKPGLLQDIKKALDECTGTNEVVLVLGDQSKKQAIKLPFTVSIEETLTRKLAEIVGAANVVVQ